MTAPPAPSASTGTPAHWHALAPDEALATLQADAHGLAPAEAARRLARHGPNRLAETPPVPAWRRFARQFDNLLLRVLIAAAAVTLLIGHPVDAAAILAVVLVNAVIGHLQEGKAERALQAIRHLLAPRAVVVRGGHTLEIAADDVVPGDIVLLAPGDRMPADVRLLQSHNLHADESALTGESVPVSKRVDAVPADAPIADRRCIGHAGTMVTQGQARAVVVATGTDTEIGRIGRLLAGVDVGTTPLLRRMAEFARRLTLVILVAAALLFAFGMGVRGYAAADMFMAAVGLAVAAIPEGLPAVLTITMAIGVQRMARRHAVIRRLPAVETLGSVTVIGSDKTGTLTRNEMTVQQAVVAGVAVDVGGVGYAPRGGLSVAGEPLPPAALPTRLPTLAALAEAAALCNDAALHERDGEWRLAGDPTEGALLAFAMKAGVRPEDLTLARPRIAAIPFDSDLRYMATLHDDAAGTGRVALVKGAPERVLALCADQAPAGDADGREPLDAAAWHAAVEAQARQGRRVLAVARRALPADRHELTHADLEGRLTLLGLVAIIDPPREEAMRAVARCREAGIRVVMITGDHAVTAGAIAERLGLGDGAPPVTGPEVEAADDDRLRELVRRTHVFARASPEHKLRLVRALQADGEVVAMTGDGVNDAPALKQADVGVAMGRNGTEAAKQAAPVVLADDNFASIAHAVEEGRTVYDNLRKAVTFLLPINGGESLTLLVAVLAGVALPILPVQILWVNMVSSVVLAMVLAFEPTEADVMRRPPRPADEPLLTRFLVWRVAFVSALFLAGIFGLHRLALAHGLDEAAARTLAVNALVAMEVFYLFSVRYLKAPSFTWRGVRGTPRVLAAVAAVVVLQAAFTWAPPMQALLGTAAVPPAQLAWAVAAGVAVLLVLEVEKTLLRRFAGPEGPGPTAPPPRVRASAG